MSSQLSDKAFKATKWSTAAELASRLVAPISTMVLARVLTPEAFGVLVTATMVISFAEIFTDAGFQKYLIQHDFRDKPELYKSTNVAFIANLTFSLFLWLIICIFSEDIAELVGNKGSGMVITVSSVCIPLAAFSSIQMALYKRHFDFKTLFIVRMVGVAIPIVITIPLAILFKSYWALIGGMIALNLSNAVILTCKSEWKPKLWFSFKEFRRMFSFTGWSMLEAVSIWATSYVDIFLIGKLMNDYYVGLYRTSINTVNQFINLITAAIVPVLFSTISRLQNDPKEFNDMFLKFQKIISILVVPLGVCIFLYKHLITGILLGSQWDRAAYFIGLWALTSSVTIIWSNLASEVYRAKGRPRISVMVQVAQILLIIPAVLLTIPKGFDTLCEWRSLVRLAAILINVITLYYFVRISPMEQIKNVMPTIFCSVCIVLMTYIIPISQDYLISIVQLVGSGVLYLSLMMLFPKERNFIFNLKKIIKKR